MQMTLELPEEIAMYVQAIAKKTGKNHSQVTTDMLADCMRRDVVKNMNADGASEHAPEDAKISPYEVFNYDLESMKKAVEAEFFEMPTHLNSPDDIGEWLKATAQHETAT